MKRTAGEEGMAVMEVLLLLAILTLLLHWAVPSAIRIYKYGAVRYEAEHLLSELRYEQMKARTTAQNLGKEGALEVTGTRPRLRLTGTGYIVYRGRDEVKRHNCLFSVRF